MFWVDGVNMRSYLINKESSILIGFKIPKDEWRIREVTFVHIKVFRRVLYINIKDADIQITSKCKEVLLYWL